MKSFEQFCIEAYQLDENILNKAEKFVQKTKPLKNLMRLSYGMDVLNKNISPAERAVSAAGVVAPITTGISRFTFNQGQTGSELDRLSKFGSKNLQIPTGTGVKIGQNPSTDIGRRLSDKIGKEVSSLVQNTNRRTNLIRDIKRAVSSGNYGM